MKLQTSVVSRIFLASDLAATIRKSKPPTHDVTSKNILVESFRIVRLVGIALQRDFHAVIAFQAGSEALLFKTNMENVNPPGPGGGERKACIRQDPFSVLVLP